jgi:hypothetical protein
MDLLDHKPIDVTHATYIDNSYILYLTELTIRRDTTVVNLEMHHGPLGFGRSVHLGRPSPSAGPSRAIHSLATMSEPQRALTAFLVAVNLHTGNIDIRYSYLAMAISTA